ncbi:dienelactone hydrolase family protein [bacterium]|nr:dienelactone hydrolase family protein [bacterium]QQR59982.1 MAG: dienelactone hydrolase family protein [Candidatus Melainabacteria bacterium]
MSEMITTHVSDGYFDGYLAIPKSGEGPSILLIQEIFGVNSHIKKFADKLADEGFVVLAPDLFWRLQPQANFGYEGADKEKAFALMQKFDEQQGLQDLKAASGVLRYHPACTGRMASFGFCLGGKLAFRLAAHTNLNCAISYYPGGIDAHLDEANSIKCKTLLHFGKEDQLIPESVREKVKDELQKYKNFTIYEYENVGHGFNCDERESYNQEAAELAYKRSLEVLKSELGLL